MSRIETEDRETEDRETEDRETEDRRQGDRRQKTEDTKMASALLLSFSITPSARGEALVFCLLSPSLLSSSH
jgi:hypothetical protein